MRPCSVEGCPNPHRARGWCKIHYLRMMQFGSLETRPTYECCTIDGCTAKPRSRTSPYCETHYYRIRRNGSVALKLVAKKPARDGFCDQCGKSVKKCFSFVFCSIRCATRSRRGRSEQSTSCAVCGKLLVETFRSDKRFCSWICREQFVGKRANLDLLGERDAWRCHICGKHVNRNEASQDHIIPASQGGSSDLVNLALAHRKCNSRRGAGRIPAQMRLTG